MARLSLAAHKKSFVCAEVRPAAILDARAGGPQRGRSRGCGYRSDAPTPRLGTDARVQGRGHLSAAKLKEQLACDTGSDGVGLERGPEFLRLPPGATVRTALGKARPGPRCRDRRNGKESVAAEGVCWRQAKVGSTFKFADEGRKRKAGAAESPPPPETSSQRGLPPWRPPGSPTRREKLREGPEELTYFGAEVVALGPAEGGERGAEREQGEQEAAGGSRGGRHGPRRRGTGRCGLRGGAHALGSRRRWGRAAALLGRLCLLKERNVDS